MTDVFTPYENAPRQLLDQLGKDHPRFAEVTTFQGRLLENIIPPHQEWVNITRFGKVDLCRYPERMGVHPRTGEPLLYTERISISSSSTLKRRAGEGSP